MRLFFGLEPDQATTLQIADWRDRQFPAFSRPVPPANFHITLAFLGEIQARDREQLCQSAASIFDTFEPSAASILLDRTGYWPRPGIYWLGASQWPSCLDKLSQQLRKAGAKVGARRTRDKFTPHITLFRGCNKAPPAAAIEPRFELRFDHFALFESRQGRSAVSYHPLESWEFSPR